MKKPVIELKNIKVAAFASEETHCYEASLYVDGVRWGVVGNDGHGGMDRFHGEGKTYADLKTLDEQIKATYPKIDMEYAGAGPGSTLDTSLEILCGDLVNNFIMAKEAKKAVTKRVSFTKEPLKQGVAIYEIKLKVPAHEAPTIANVKAKYPEAVILNELTTDEVVAALRMAA